MIVLDAALKVFLWIAIIIVAILQVILFFKLWRMTDNVAGILRILERKFQEAPAENVSNEPENNDPWGVGALVVEKSTGRQMRIKNVNKGGRFSCTIGQLDAGEFSWNEIIPFEQYVSQKPIEATNDDVQLWPVLVIIGIFIFVFGIFLVASQS